MPASEAPASGALPDTPASDDSPGSDESTQDGDGADSPGGAKTDAPCGPPAGTTLDIRTQDQADELAGCKEVLGALVIDPATGVQLDLRPLTSLQRVRGELSIGCTPYSFRSTDCQDSAAASLALDGLENLEEAAALWLAGLSFTSLAPLRGLRHVESLTIDRCSELESLAGLEGVRFGSVRLYDNARLSSLAGLTFEANTPSIQLEAMPLLTDVTALEAVTSTGYLFLRGLPLQNLDALSSVTSLGKVFLSDMQELRDISTLGRAGEIGELHVSDTALVDFDGLQLAGVGWLSIRENAQLTNVDALASLTSLGDVEVYGNTLLQRLPVLAGITRVSSVRITANDVLVEGPSFPNLVDMAGGTLSFLANPNLQRVDGFSSLEQGGDIYIVQNSSLASVAFPRLQRASALQITCNAALPDMSLDALSELPTSAGNSVYGNLGSEAPCVP